MSAYSSIAKLLKAKAAVYNIGISSNMWIRVACIILPSRRAVNGFPAGMPVFFLFCKDRGKTAGNIVYGKYPANMV